MKLLTIGEFARASRLSPKALRLYDELGLLHPVRVDEYSGYRYYSPDQLDQASLVAWLRHAGPAGLPWSRQPAPGARPASPADRHRHLAGPDPGTRRHSGSKGPATGT